MAGRQVRLSNLIFASDQQTLRTQFESRLSEPLIRKRQCRDHETTYSVRNCNILWNSLPSFPIGSSFQIFVEDILSDGRTWFRSLTEQSMCDCCFLNGRIQFTYQFSSLSRSHEDLVIPCNTNSDLYYDLLLSKSKLILLVLCTHMPSLEKKATRPRALRPPCITDRAASSITISDWCASSTTQPPRHEPPSGLRYTLMRTNYLTKSPNGLCIMNRPFLIHLWC